MGEDKVRPSIVIPDVGGFVYVVLPPTGEVAVRPVVEGALARLAGVLVVSAFVDVGRLGRDGRSEQGEGEQDSQYRDRRRCGVNLRLS